MTPSKLKTAVKLCIMIALLAVLYKMYRDEFVTVITNISSDAIYFFLAAVAACGIDVFFSCHRQKETLEQLAGPTPFSQYVAATYAGLFANFFLPGGLGLDACRLLYHPAAKKCTMNSMGGWIILDKVVCLAAIFTVMFIMISSAVFLGWVPLTFLSLCGIAISLSCLGMIVLLFVILNSKSASKRANVYAKKWHAVELFQKTVRKLDVRRYTPRSLFRALGWAILGRSSLVLALGIIAYPYYGLEEALKATALSPLVMLANQLPVTPGNLGWTETSAALVWKSFNFDGGGIIFLTWRVAQTVFALGGGILFLKLKRVQYAKINEDHPHISNHRQC